MTAARGASGLAVVRDPGRRVLLIEDDADAADSMRQVLVTRGFEVTVASSGRAGLAAIVPFAPDVVVVDLGLPDMDGLEVAIRLRDDPRTAELQLVAMSGYRRTAGPASRFAGFDAWLVKPVAIDELVRAIGGDRRGP